MIEQLTQRELELLALFADGQRGKEVARSMGITVETVKTYSAMVRLKMRAKNTTHAVAIALRHRVMQ
jgi:LuxR family quorum sensing-dependent transcriptional regulator